MCMRSEAGDRRRRLDVWVLDVGYNYTLLPQPPPSRRQPGIGRDLLIRTHNMLQYVIEMKNKKGGGDREGRQQTNRH